MKTIKLTQGQVAIIDDEDFERVNQFKWSAQKIVHKNGVVYYAKRTIWLDWKLKKQKTITLHRFILNAPDGVEVDHKNRQPLDCRRQNLRLATPAQNKMNRAAVRPGTYKGIEFRPRTGKYLATIRHNRQNLHLGLHSTAKSAARAYDLKARELFGEFACLNFPEQEI